MGLPVTMKKIVAELELSSSATKCRNPGGAYHHSSHHPTRPLDQNSKQVCLHFAGVYASISKAQNDLIDVTISRRGWNLIDEFAMQGHISCSASTTFAFTLLSQDTHRYSSKNVL